MHCLQRNVPSNSGSITQSSVGPCSRCHIPEEVGLKGTPKPNFGGSTFLVGFTRVQHALQLYSPFVVEPELDGLHEDIDAAKDDLYLVKSLVRCGTGRVVVVG